MEYTFIGYGVNAGKFTGKDGKPVEYCTDVVVVQGTDKETGFRQVKQYKLSRGFNKAQIRGGQVVTFACEKNVSRETPFLERKPPKGGLSHLAQIAVTLPHSSKAKVTT